MNPFTTALFAWQSGLVFALRSFELWAEPARAQGRLLDYALEKQRAFADGTVAAGKAALSGGDGTAVMAAALRPAQRRVRVNARKLLQG